MAGSVRTCSGSCRGRMLDRWRPTHRLGRGARLEPRQTLGGAAVDGGLGGGEADVAGDPAGVGAGGDVEVADVVDRSDRRNRGS